MSGGIEGVQDFRSASTAFFRHALVTWIDDRRTELEPPYRDHGSTEEILSHQRRVQRLLFDDGFMRWGWPAEVGGLGGSPLFRAVLGEELTGRGLVHSAAYAMTEFLGPGPGPSRDCLRRRHSGGGGRATDAPR
jgi:alkylation response protein AidB-like acyl-CoA dehydrogenase